ncbi:MAG: exodeoxyribonuclease VII large subunit [Mastigocoleus sp. MO_167.B18]|nr:exodeoxyribonuclease VII large subunit [Mastigocoleus sp. MO_167.B18]
MSFELSNSAVDLIADTALSVTGLTDYIRLLVEEDKHLRQIWVKGEVSSANNHKVGLFFTFQDPDGGTAIKCVIWRSQLGKLAQLPKVGEQLIILGSLRLYPARGEYQLNVWQTLPAGVGLQALRYQQLRKRLEAEGLFDIERKKSLPTHPQAIAVVTSPTAAAWGDIQKTLRQRYPGLHVLFSPATVQGEQAPSSIVKAIKRVEQDKRAEVLILSRGGGAVEELACFNDERVVRAVAECPIPVITGIGHQRDESLVDLVADRKVHTPTAAAELVVPAIAELYSQHQERVTTVCEVVGTYYTDEADRLQLIENRLRRLGLERQTEQELQALSWKRQRLLQGTTSQLQQSFAYVEMLRQKLVTLDPKAVLKRGYAVVRQENGIIARCAADLTEGDRLLVELNDGEIQVRVTEIKNTRALRDKDCNDHEIG